MHLHACVHMCMHARVKEARVSRTYMPACTPLSILPRPKLKYKLDSPTHPPPPILGIHQELGKVWPPPPTRYWDR